MFKKKPNIKAFAPLRSSERRKIADQIIKEYEVEVPALVENNAGEGEPATEAINLGTIRNQILPDNAQSARFMTTIGADLKQVSGTVYAGAHPNEDQRILWFKFEERFIPTGAWSDVKPSSVLTTVLSLYTLEKSQPCPTALHPWLRPGQTSPRISFDDPRSSDGPSLPIKGQEECGGSRC